MNGHLIKAAREAKKISQQWLAEQLGIDDTTLGKIENNKTNITFKRMVEISKILKVNICEFIPPELLSNKKEEEYLHQIELLTNENLRGERTSKAVMHMNFELAKSLEEALDGNKKLMKFINHANITMKREDFLSD